MDEFKISLFESEHNISFPKYKTLSGIECLDLFNSIVKKYNINPLSFEVDLASKQSFYKSSDAMEGFELIVTLTNMGIEPMSTLLVNWYKFERIDAFGLDDLNRYFYDIWFSSSDDIDIFDKSLNWIVSIRHDGCVSFLKNK